MHDNKEFTKVWETIILTPKAVNEVKNFRAAGDVPETHGLRIGVKGGGSAPVSYSLGFEASAAERDTVIESGGIKIFMDPRSKFYLGGMVLDFVDGEHGRGFVFRSSQPAGSCNCGGGTC